MPVCTNCGQDNPDIARFCLACGAPLEAAAAEPVAPPLPPEEERKLITVVFTDLVGSTSRSENLDPEDVKAMVAPYHARVRAELERFGGTFEKFSGDAVMAIFGAPTAHEDDPERAVRAALAIRAAIEELNTENEWLDLHIRTGVNTGEALVMLEARPTEGEWMAAGDVMNTAARIQSGAPVDGILVGEETYRTTKHLIEYREAEAVQAKGKSEPVPVWEVVALREDVARRTSARAPLIGREKEFERLWKAWEDVQTQHARILVTVVGPPGIGKTRLLEEFIHRAEGAAVHWGRCLSYGEGITYWPVIEILKDAAGIRNDDSADETSLKLGSFLFDLGTDDFDQLRTMATALANLIGAPRTPERTYSAAEITQAELHWGIRRVLELLAEKRPLVVVFEDLHWAEPTLLDLLRSIVESVSDAPILLIGSARPEVAETRPTLVREEANRRVIELDSLAAADSEAMLAELLGVEDVAVSEVAQRLLTNAGGNPLFLEEIVGMLTDAGLVGRGEAALAEIAEIPVPSSLQALIGSRLDGLPGGEKRRAQHASVAGTVFWPGALSYAEHPNGDGARSPNGDLLASLDSLEQRDMIYAREISTIAGEREYAFKHILIRDVAYGRVPKGRRAELHTRFASWTSALPGGDDDLIEIVAYHLEQACHLARGVARSPVTPPVLEAIQALERAGEKAESREGFREADRFYARALELVGDEHAELATELRLRRGRMLSAEGHLAEASERLERVAEEARALGRLDLRCAALIAYGNIETKQGRAADADASLEEAETIAVEIGDRQLEARATYERAFLRGWFEGPSEAIVDLRRALAIAEELGDRALRIEGYMRLSWTLFNRGDLAETEEQTRHCLELAGDVGSHRDEARSTLLLALVTYYRGDLDEAERLALQALEWLDRTSDTYLQIQDYRALAKFALARDEPEQAERRLREALPLALEAGGWLLIEIYRYLAEALVRQGRVEDAREIVAFAARSLPEEDAYARAALLLAEAFVAVAGGEQTAASTSFSEALRLLEEQQLWLDLGEARIALAHALRSFGDVAGAQTELERARALLGRLEARSLTAAIARELAEISEGAGAAGPLG